MKFAPKSENEIKSANLLPAGEYDAEIGTAEDKVSSAGNEMIKLDVTVYDSSGNKRFVYDYLLEAMAYKLRHAAEACGLLDKYEAGLIEAEDFIGKSCKVKVKIQEDKTGQYPPKNVIADYVVESDPRLSPTVKPKTVNETLKDDSIPF